MSFSDTEDQVQSQIQYISVDDLPMLKQMILEGKTPGTRYTPTQMYHCELCQFRTSCANKFKSHMMTHKATAKVHTCPRCEKGFQTPSRLKAHMLTHEDKNFVCMYCEKKFKRNYSLNIHMKNVHLGTSEFKCHICEKVFSSNSTLKKHIMQIHQADAYKN